MHIFVNLITYGPQAVINLIVNQHCKADILWPPAFTLPLGILILTIDKAFYGGGLIQATHLAHLLLGFFTTTYVPSGLFVM